MKTELKAKQGKYIMGLIGLILMSPGIATIIYGLMTAGPETIRELWVLFMGPLRPFTNMIIIFTSFTGGMYLFLGATAKKGVVE